MMSIYELQRHLELLGLLPNEAASLLSVGPRTVRRWLDGSQDVSGPAEQALRAWLRLHTRGLAWRPDGVALDTGNESMITSHREHAIGLDELLKRVESRNGPSAPWVVDLNRGTATLGPMKVSFYRLSNGGFSPQSYMRTDINPNLTRDGLLVEDAFASIAYALASKN